MVDQTSDELTSSRLAMEKVLFLMNCRGQEDDTCSVSLPECFVTGIIVRAPCRIFTQKLEIPKCDKEL